MPVLNSSVGGADEPKREAIEAIGSLYNSVLHLDELYKASMGFGRRLVTSGNADRTFDINGRPRTPIAEWVSKEIAIDLHHERLALFSAANACPETYESFEGLKRMKTHFELSTEQIEEHREFIHPGLGVPFLIETSPGPISERLPLLGRAWLDAYRDRSQKGVLSVPLWLGVSDPSKGLELAKQQLLSFHAQASKRSYAAVIASLSGIVPLQLLEWLNGVDPVGGKSSLDSNSPVPELIVEYEIVLPGGAPFCVVLKSGSIDPLRPNHLRRSEPGDIDVDTLVGLQRALDNAAFSGALPLLHGCQDTDFLKARSTLRGKAPCERSLGDYLTLIESYTRGLAREISATPPPHETNLGPDNWQRLSSLDSFNQNLATTVKNLRDNPDNPRPEKFQVPDEHVPTFVAWAGTWMFNHIIEARARANEYSTPELQSQRERDGYFGPRTGYPLPLPSLAWDMTTQYCLAKVDQKENAGTPAPPPPPESAYFSSQRTSIDDCSKVLMEIPPEKYILLECRDPATGKVRYQRSETAIEDFVATSLKNQITHYYTALSKYERQDHIIVLTELVRRASAQLATPPPPKVEGRTTTTHIFLDMLALLDDLERRAGYSPTAHDQVRNVRMNFLSSIESYVYDPARVVKTILLEIGQKMHSSSGFDGEDIEAMIRRLDSARERHNQLQQERELGYGEITWDGDREGEEGDGFQFDWFPSGGLAKYYDLDHARGRQIVTQLQYTPQFDNLRITDNCWTKFIYVIDGNGQVWIAPEIAHKGKQGRKRRPTHAQIAGAESVFGAGEFTVGYYDKVFSSIETWRRWRNTELRGGIRDLCLFEINNLSGHYRPDFRCLEYAKRLICRALDKQGIYTANVSLVNRLMPGMKRKLTY